MAGQGWRVALVGWNGLVKLRVANWRAKGYNDRICCDSVAQKPGQLCAVFAEQLSTGDALTSLNQQCCRLLCDLQIGIACTEANLHLGLCHIVVHGYAEYKPQALVESLEVESLTENWILSRFD